MQYSTVYHSVGVKVKAFRRPLAVSTRSKVQAGVCARLICVGDLAVNICFHVLPWGCFEVSLIVGRYVGNYSTRGEAIIVRSNHERVQAVDRGVYCMYE